MIPYNDPRNLWQVYRAEWERTQAALHVERLARQARRAGADGMSARSRARRWAMLRSVRCGFRTWLPALVTGRSTVPCGTCCA